MPAAMRDEPAELWIAWSRSLSSVSVIANAQRLARTRLDQDANL
jgi:hypothetical protein